MQSHEIYSEEFQQRGFVLIDTTKGIVRVERFPVPRATLRLAIWWPVVENRRKELSASVLEPETGRGDWA